MPTTIHECYVDNDRHRQTVFAGLHRPWRRRPRSHRNPSLLDWAIKMTETSQPDWNWHRNHGSWRLPHVTNCIDTPCATGWHHSVFNMVRDAKSSQVNVTACDFDYVFDYDTENDVESKEDTVLASLCGHFPANSFDN